MPPHTLGTSNSPLYPLSINMKLVCHLSIFNFFLCFYLAYFFVILFFFIFSVQHFGNRCLFFLNVLYKQTGLDFIKAFRKQRQLKCFYQLIRPQSVRGGGRGGVRETPCLCHSMKSHVSRDACSAHSLGFPPRHAEGQGTPPNKSAKYILMQRIFFFFNVVLFFKWNNTVYKEEAIKRRTVGYIGSNTLSQFLYQCSY